MFERLLRYAMRIYAKLHYDLVLARKGYGTPIAQEHWDAGYGKEGDSWNFLDTAGELGRYALIAAYANQMHQSPAILEIGCGHGSLVEMLARFGFKSYLGVDLSPEAIKRAEALGIDGASFEVADLETWSPPGQFDSIVFNETLYYAKQPTETLERFAANLKEKGVLIVSMHRGGNHGIIWHQLLERFEILYSTGVQNQVDQAWDVRVLRPKQAEAEGR